jgi:hypothetical protein
MKTWLLILFIATAGLLLAQTENPFGIIHHSSTDVEGKLHLRWDDYSEGAGEIECLYNSNNGAWENAPTTTPNPGTMETLVPYSFDTKLRYRLRYSMDYMNESFALLHAAYWDADTFPPDLNKTAFIGADPAGDSVMVYTPNLDLTESYIATTSQKIYLSIKNFSGSFPTMNSLTSYNIYLASITNIEAVNDSVTYAMVYSFNIPGVISSGLYKIGFDELTQMPTFARLGSIQSQVSGGALHLACNISDLTADPDFGAWPNVSASLVLMGVTMAIDIDLQTMEPTIGLGDYSTPGYVVFIDNYYQVAQNSLPVCAGNNWDAENSLLYISYDDADGDFPLIAQVKVASDAWIEALPVEPLNPGHTMYYAYVPNSGSSPVFSYNFSDNGIDMVSGTWSPVSLEDENLVPASISCSMPNPLRSGHTIKITGLNSNACQVQLFNLKGQKMGNLFAGKSTSDALNIAWDGRLKGKILPSGVYFIRIENSGIIKTHKFVIAK